MAATIPRKSNLIADKCAVFEANKNSGSQSSSFLTNLVRRKTTAKDVVKDDSTQATVDISENSSTTIGSCSASASIRNGTFIETMDVIGEDSMNDNMYKHLRPRMVVTRRQTSLISRLNMSDVSFDTVCPQVSSSNLFQNSLDSESIHQPVTEACATTISTPLSTHPLQQQPRRRSTVVTSHRAVFEGCSCPSSGVSLSQQQTQSKSPGRVGKNSRPAPKSREPMRIAIKDEKDSGSKAATVQSPVTVTFEKTTEKKSHSRRHDSRERRTTRKPDKSSKNHDASPRHSNVSPERKSLSHKHESSPEIQYTAVKSPVAPQTVNSQSTEPSTPSPRHTLHESSPIVIKSGTSQAAIPRIKSPKQRKAMLKRLLKNKRKPSVEAG